MEGIILTHTFLRRETANFAYDVEYWVLYMQ